MAVEHWVAEGRGVPYYCGPSESKAQEVVRAFGSSCERAYRLLHGRCSSCGQFIDTGWKMGRLPSGEVVMVEPATEAAA